MSKYDALGVHLRGSSRDEVALTFSEIEKIAGVALPPKAQEHRAWWSNNPSNNVMTKVWLAAGFETAKVDMVARKLVFRRIKPQRENPPGAFSPGLSEPHRMFKADENIEKKPRRSPLFGALRGTFMIEPGWDLTKPALDPEELAVWEANLDRTADMIDEGLSGNRK
jgi:hypothetical protein